MREEGEVVDKHGSRRQKHNTIEGSSMKFVGFVAPLRQVVSFRAKACVVQEINIPIRNGFCCVPATSFVLTYQYPAKLQFTISTDKSSRLDALVCFRYAKRKKEGNKF